jgi:hypothetical protein
MKKKTRIFIFMINDFSVTPVYTARNTISIHIFHLRKSFLRRKHFLTNFKVSNCIKILIKKWVGNVIIRNEKKNYFNMIFYGFKSVKLRVHIYIQISMISYPF